jgi:hypothetical protein
MKHYIFGLLFFSLLSNNIYGQDAFHPMAMLTKRDRQHLQHLYYLDKTSSLTEKIATLDLDYYIGVLYNHIQLLNHKIQTKQNGWTSKSFGNGLCFLALSGLFGIIPFVERPKDPSIAFTLLALPFFLIASESFYKAARYQQRLIQRLERDKRIYRKLQAEWHLRNSSSSE